MHHHEDRLSLFHRVNPVEYLISSKAIHTQGRIHTISHTKYDAIGTTPQGQPYGILFAVVRKLSQMDSENASP